jgi:hypothetical protein
MHGAVMNCVQMAGSWPERLDHKTVAELSRAAKRRRLGRIVRADVTAEAAEPQAATPRTTREPLGESRATRRPRLEEPKRERRPAEARTQNGKGAMASTTRSDSTRARTRRSTQCACWRRTRAIRSDASEARRAKNAQLTNGDPAKLQKRRAGCSYRSRQPWKDFSQA